MPKFDLSSLASKAKATADTTLEDTAAEAALLFEELVNRDDLPRTAHLQLVTQTRDVLSQINDGSFDKDAASTLISGRPIAALSAGTSTTDDSDNALATSVKAMASDYGTDPENLLAFVQSLLEPLQDRSLTTAEKNARATVMGRVARAEAGFEVTPRGELKASDDYDALKDQHETDKQELTDARRTLASLKPVTDALNGIGDNATRNARFQAATKVLQDGMPDLSNLTRFRDEIKQYGKQGGIIGHRNDWVVSLSEVSNETRADLGLTSS